MVSQFNSVLLYYNSNNWFQEGRTRRNGFIGLVLICKPIALCFSIGWTADAFNSAAPTKQGEYKFKSRWQLSLYFLCVIPSCSVWSELWYMINNLKTKQKPKNWFLKNWQPILIIMVKIV